MQTRRKTLYYGWIITVTLAITETISYGIIYYAFSVFITPMEAELGWSRTDLTGGFSLGLLVMAAMAFPVGNWVDKYGSRLLMTLGSICASILVMGWSQVNQQWEFYLVWAGLGLCASMVLYEPAFAVMATWFVRRRGRALAIITFAAGLASTIFVPFSDYLLNAVGWRDAILLLGIFLGVTTIPLHALILRRRPADLGLVPDGEDNAIEIHQSAPVSFSLGDALHSRFFWVLTVAFGLSALSSAAIRVHFIPLLIDNGINPSRAAWASGTIGLMQVAGRVVFAPLEARFSARTMVTGVFVMQALSIMFFLPGISLFIVGIFLVIFGTSYGAKTLARASVIAELFGASHYGRISSVMSIFLTIAGTLAPVGAGLLYDRFGNYDMVLWVAMILGVFAVGVMFLSKPDIKSSLTLQSAVANE
ncbi:MAG: MFS transporter [Aggregatilineales bacterium]